MLGGGDETCLSPKMPLTSGMNDPCHPAKGWACPGGLGHPDSTGRLRGFEKTGLVIFSSLLKNWSRAWNPPTLSPQKGTELVLEEVTQVSGPD